VNPQDYEMLDQDAAQLERIIRTFPDTVKSLTGAILFAMLGWAQAENDTTVYELCRVEMDRRNTSEYRSLSERMAMIHCREADEGCIPEARSTPRIVTTAIDLGFVFDALQTAREHVQAGEPHDVIDAELYRVFEKLVDISLRSLDDDEAAVGPSH